MAWRDNPVAGFTKAQRLAILKRDPICQCSGCRACRGACSARSTEADHRLNRATCAQRGIDPNTLDNGQGLCAACHSVKTVGEAAAARRATYSKLRHPSAR